MGQAKRRGTFEERKVLAIKRDAGKRKVERRFVRPEDIEAQKRTAKLLSLLFGGIR